MNAAASALAVPVDHDAPPLLGFCMVEQDDVPISPDGRCLADNSMVLPPSTLCQHRRLSEGAWSPCTRPKPHQCTEQPPGKFREVLAQMPPPKPQVMRAPTLISKPSVSPPVRTSPSRQGPRTSEKRKRRRTSRGPKTDRRRLVPLPCPICNKKFLPKLNPGGKRQMTCSMRCAARYRADHPEIYPRDDSTLAAQAAQMREGRAAKRGTSWGPGGLEACSEHGKCDRPYKAHGRCDRCYRRWYKRQSAAEQMRSAS